MNDGFPVVVEMPLGAPTKRMGGLIPPKRALSELPIQEPGTVLVFESAGGTWTPARGRLTGTEPFVVNAISVSMVKMRTQTVDTEIQIASVSAADDFTIRVQFNCRVSDATLVAQQGPIDVPKILADYLRQDRGLLVKGQEASVEDLRAIRIAVDARVRAYCHEISPRIPGVEVSLASVEVLTPSTWRIHVTKIRDAHWNRDLQTLLNQHQDEDVRRLAAFFRDPEMIAAIGKIEDKIDLQQLFSDALADRRLKDANILELLKLLEKNGQLDRLPINGRALVDTLMVRLAGAEIQSGSDGPSLSIDTDGLTSLDGRTDPAALASDDAKEDRFVVHDHPDE